MHWRRHERKGDWRKQLRRPLIAATSTAIKAWYPSFEVNPMLRFVSHKIDRMKDLGLAQIKNILLIRNVHHHHQIETARLLNMVRALHIEMACTDQEFAQVHPCNNLSLNSLRPLEV